MSFQAGLRTPAEVAAITLEDVGGLPPSEAKKLSDDLMRRIALCLKKMTGSDKDGTHWESILRMTPDAETMQWGSVTWNDVEGQVK